MCPCNAQSPSLTGVDLSALRTHDLIALTNHNHNDVGAFIVVVGKTPVLLDLGSEVYTSRTFSPKRYESKVLNSYGHPMPLVSGKLQSTGSKARGQVLKAEFTESVDTLQLDITSAYAVKELKKPSAEPEEPEAPKPPPISFKSELEEPQPGTPGGRGDLAYLWRFPD